MPRKPKAAPVAPVAAPAAPTPPTPAPDLFAGQPPPVGPMEWAEFRDQLPKVCDTGALAKALTMLRAEKFGLFADVKPDLVTGVVRSQSSAGRVYACRLDAEGKYSCCTQNLITCVVSGRSPCKHMLVLVVGLAKAGQVDLADTLGRLKLAKERAPRRKDWNKPDKDEAAAIFLKYKGVVAGEIDWRPTETIPEDFYSA